MTPPDVVRAWARRWDVQLGEPPWYRWPESEGRTHRLWWESGTAECAAWFTELPGHPGTVRVHSMNWRVEHEVAGFLPVQQARRLWRELVGAGMEWDVTRLGGAP